MTLARATVAERTPSPRPHHGRPTGLLAWLTSTDHKRIGIGYMVTAFGFFLIGGVDGRWSSGPSWPSRASSSSTPDTYNELFTMHGSDHAVPVRRARSPSGWPTTSCRCRSAPGTWPSPASTACRTGCTSAAASSCCSGLPHRRRAPPTSAGSPTRRCPTASARPASAATSGSSASPCTGLSGILTAVNIVTTVAHHAGAGHDACSGMPIFTWNMLVTSVLVLLAFPVLTAAGAMLFADRHFGGHIFDAGQRRACPSCGSTCSGSSATPRSTSSSCRTSAWSPRSSPCSPAGRCSATRASCFATLAIGCLSVGVWAHHMFATGAVLLPFFAGIDDAHRRADRA